MPFITLQLPRMYSGVYGYEYGIIQQELCRRNNPKSYEVLRIVYDDHMIVLQSL